MTDSRMAFSRLTLSIMICSAIIFGIVAFSRMTFIRMRLYIDIPKTDSEEKISALSTATLVHYTDRVK
jgi:hypothetical protein